MAVSYTHLVNHVRREQRLTGSSEVFFTRVQQTVDPRQQFLRAVVGVQDNRLSLIHISAR